MDMNFENVTLKGMDINGDQKFFQRARRTFRLRPAAEQGANTRPAAAEHNPGRPQAKQLFFETPKFRMDGKDNVFKTVPKPKTMARGAFNLLRSACQGTGNALIFFPVRV